MRQFARHAVSGGSVLTDTEAQHSSEIEAASQQKSDLLIEAQEVISIWQTELQLGIINDEDKTNLILWLKYIKAVLAVDVSTAPSVNWPVKP